MNRICYHLSSHEMWLGLPIDCLFTTQKKADDYFQNNCIGTGIIVKVRAINPKIKFKEGIAINPETTKLIIQGKEMR